MIWRWKELPWWRVALDALLLLSMLLVTSSLQAPR
jgi:hypothetical protein